LTDLSYYFQYLEAIEIATESQRERQYYAHSGLSRGAIQKAWRTARPVAYGDGS